MDVLPCTRQIEVAGSRSCPVIVQVDQLVTEYLTHVAINQFRMGKHFLKQQFTPGVCPVIPQGAQIGKPWEIRRAVNIHQWLGYKTELGFKRQPEDQVPVFRDAESLVKSADVIQEGT